MPSDVSHTQLQGGEAQLKGREGRRPSNFPGGAMKRRVCLTTAQGSMSGLKQGAGVQPGRSQEWGQGARGDKREAMPTGQGG